MRRDFGSAFSFFPPCQIENYGVPYLQIDTICQCDREIRTSIRRILTAILKNKAYVAETHIDTEVADGVMNPVAMVLRMRQTFEASSGRIVTAASPREFGEWESSTRC